MPTAGGAFFACCFFTFPFSRSLLCVTAFATEAKAEFTLCSCCSVGRRLSCGELPSEEPVVGMRAVKAGVKSERQLGWRGSVLLLLLRSNTEAMTTGLLLAGAPLVELRSPDAVAKVNSQ